MRPTIRRAPLLRLLSFSFALAPLCALAQESDVLPVGEVDPMLALTRSLYHPEGWPRGELRVGFDLAAFELAGYEGGALEPVGDLVLRRFRATEEGASGFHVELFVASDVEGAHGELVSWLASVSSFDPVPRAAELGIAAGDVGFAGRSPHGDEYPHWIGFVRGNLAFKLVATDLRAEARPSLAALARRIDALAGAARKLAEGETVPRPTVETFEIERPSLRAGETMRIELALSDPLGGKVEPHFVLGGPATGYVERASDGTLLLYTTGPGAMELRLEALGSNGTFTRRSLFLTVR